MVRSDLNTSDVTFLFWGTVACLLSFWGWHDERLGWAGWIPLFAFPLYLAMVAIIDFRRWNFSWARFLRAANIAEDRTIATPLQVTHTSPVSYDFISIVDSSWIVVEPDTLETKAQPGVPIENIEMPSSCQTHHQKNYCTVACENVLYRIEVGTRKKILKSECGQFVAIVPEDRTNLGSSAFLICFSKRRRVILDLGDCDCDSIDLSRSEARFSLSFYIPPGILVGNIRILLDPTDVGFAIEDGSSVGGAHARLEGFKSIHGSGKSD